MTQEWLKNDANMTHEWLKNDANMTQEWLKNDEKNADRMIPIWRQNDVHMMSNWFWLTYFIVFCDMLQRCSVQAVYGGLLSHQAFPPPGNAG